jgi:hypothetical protein
MMGRSLHLDSMHETTGMVEMLFDGFLPCDCHLQSLNIINNPGKISILFECRFGGTYCS